LKEPQEAHEAHVPFVHFVVSSMFAMYILAAIAILQGILTLLDGIRSARHMRTYRPKPGGRSENVTVFCPCKGTDPEFQKNIESILNQDYPHYEAWFIVESEHDTACSVLRALGANVLVAGRASDRGQKVHNLAFAIQQRGSAGIYVFCDSDARFPSNWLSNLLAPLDSSNITTGYRWYVPTRFHFPTLMRSAWNASSVSILGDHDRNFAWGGSTALYRETFERLGILDAWRGSVSDDYSITRRAQATRTKIIFVPECLIPSYGECTFRELLEFTTRQIIITRVYHPGLWRVGFAGHLIFNAAFWVLPLAHPYLWMVIFGLSGAKSWIRYRAVRTALSQPSLSNFGWFYILSSPLVALLYLYNMAASALGTEIVWRQIHYKLVSPNETRVYGGSPASES
jgi:cellulose synthase/poly-beta-1,6-N-acetylglucosamine synthase-like glycosyltransferase